MFFVIRIIMENIKMLIVFLKEIPDHRNRQYDLAHVLLFSILAILSNAKNYKDI